MTKTMLEMRAEARENMTLQELIEDNRREFNRAYDLLLKTLTDKTEIEVTRSFLKSLEQELDAERVYMNGLRPSDRTDTERGAWNVARRGMIDKLRKKIEKYERDTALPAWIDRQGTMSDHLF